MQLFRMEHKEYNDGMWTVRINDTRVVDLLEDRRLSDMPMPYHDRFRLHGKIWRCAVESMMDLAQWFNLKDTQQMLDLGFHVITFKNPECIIEPYQILFNDAARQTQKDITNEFLRYVQEEKTYNLLLEELVGKTVSGVAYDTDQTVKNGILELKDGTFYISGVPVHAESLEVSNASI